MQAPSPGVEPCQARFALALGRAAKITDESKCERADDLAVRVVERRHCIRPEQHAVRHTATVLPQVLRRGRGTPRTRPASSAQDPGGASCACEQTVRVVIERCSAEACRVGRVDGLRLEARLVDQENEQPVCDLAPVRLPRRLERWGLDAVASQLVEVVTPAIRARAFGGPQCRARQQGGTSPPVARVRARPAHRKNQVFHRLLRRDCRGACHRDTGRPATRDETRRACAGHVASSRDPAAAPQPPSRAVRPCSADQRAGSR